MAKQGLLVAVLVTIAAIVATRTYAHDHFRVIGTITKLEKTQFEIKDKNGKLMTIYTDKKTKVTRDKKPVAITTLKIGASVVVDAYGDDESDLLALDIRIVPSLAPTTTK